MFSEGERDKNGIQLRPYQLEAASVWASRRSHGLSRGIVNLPTGTGKTVLGLAIAKETPGRILWLAHRDELIEQPQRTIGAMWPNAEVGTVKAGKNDVAAEIVFASVQTLGRAARLDQLTAAGEFGLVVVDEAHHSAAPTYMRILEGVGAFQKQGPPVLGLTATVERGDGVRLDGAFQEVVYQLPLLSAIRAGYLVDLLMRQAPIDVDLDEVRSAAGDWQTGELGEALLQAGVADATAHAYIAHAATRKALIFAVTVEQAEMTTQALQRKGILAECLSGKTPTEERRAILGRLKSGKTMVVVNCAVLTEGFDEPSLEAIVVARPTRSKTLYLQMIGRGTRTYPGKNDCVIVDICGATRRHTLMQAPVLFGLNPREAGGKTVTEAINDRDRRADLARSVISAGREDIPRVNLHWVKADDGLFTLGLGGDHGALMLVRGAAGWDVWMKKRAMPGERLQAGVDLELAQGIAEDVARRLDVGGLVRKGAPWRDGPASEKQLAAMRAYGIPHNSSLSKGKASDLLAVFFARKDGKRLANPGGW